MTSTDKLIERLNGPIKQAALDLIAVYFGRSRKSLASIPADPKRDADLVLCEGIAEAADALTAQQKRIDELESLLPWLSDWNVYPPNGVGLSQWEIAHKDYDGAPDANDERYFQGNSKLSVLQQVADFVAEEGGPHE